MHTRLIPLFLAGLLAACSSNIVADTCPDANNDGVCDDAVVIDPDTEPETDDCVDLNGNGFCDNVNIPDVDQTRYTP